MTQMPARIAMPRMTPKTKAALAVTILSASILVAGLRAEPDYSVERPQGYRRWTHVMSYVIGPPNPAAAKNGGLHNFFANGKAVEGYRASQFPDGSILIDERNQAVDDGGVTRTGDLLHIAVMVKDSKRYAATGGWGYEVFLGDGSKGVLNAQARTGCYNCHQKQAAKDFVFTKLRD